MVRYRRKGGLKFLYGSVGGKHMAQLSIFVSHGTKYADIANSLKRSLLQRAIEQTAEREA